jgi:hypothetical protein
MSRHAAISSGLYNLHFAVAESTGDFFPDVFGSESQRFIAVRALGIRIGFDHIRAFRIEPKIGRTEFALDSLAEVFPIDLEFLMALLTFDEQAHGSYFHQAFNLR